MFGKRCNMKLKFNIFQIFTFTKKQKYIAHKYGPTSCLILAERWKEFTYNIIEVSKVAHRLLQRLLLHLIQFYSFPLQNFTQTRYKKF